MIAQSIARAREWTHGEESDPGDKMQQGKRGVQLRDAPFQSDEVERHCKSAIGEGEGREGKKKRDKREEKGNGRQRNMGLASNDVK